jgi:uncharacterized protein YndB with AHSA1/START domain
MTIRSRMTFLAFFAFMLGVTAILAVIAGGRMPRDHIAAVRGTYAAAPAQVWALISDPAQAASWRTDVKRVDMLPTNDGRVAWKEMTGNGVITYAMVAQEPMVSQISRITDERLPFGGQWEFLLTPRGSGTELLITERGFVKPALMRLLARTVFSPTKSMETYHRSLALRLQERPQITTVMAVR